MYEHIIREAMQTPLALTPRYCAIIQDILRFRASGGRLSTEELQARLQAETPRPAPRPGAGAVAVIPIYGVIAHRTFEASSGMTSTEWIGSVVRRATADEEVSAILLDCCTPGGTAVGLPEVSALIGAAKKTKYVSAIVNGEMCSAGFWLGSQAHEIVSLPSAYCGSIGVWTLFEDWSEWLAKEGIKYNAISAGEYKLEGAFWEPMSDETRAFLQGQVDKCYAEFLSAVAKGRGTTVADVKKTYGQGRVFDAKEALERGMIDRIATFEDTIARLTKMGAGGRRGTAALSPAPHPLAAAAENTCPVCQGSGLTPPETSMGDPVGQEPCETCGGTGKRSAVEPGSEHLAADRDALDLAQALTE